MDIVLLTVGILLIVLDLILISIDKDNPKQFMIFLITLIGVSCIAIGINLDDVPQKIVNHSELSNRKITITITNEKDTICDTTYVYEPKR